jgi:methyl-accepting chemotaxis protein
MNIVIIGAGKGGEKLIEMFNEMDDINLKLVVDRNFESPGILLAKKLGIKYSSEIIDIEPNIDIIVEVTGSEIVEGIIEKNYSEKTLINSKAAALMVSLVDKQKESTNMLDKQAIIINENSAKLKKESDNVSKRIVILNKTATNLGNASSESEKYILRTDELATGINKITQRMKILGLNANIEAARAGEHGKGFSIVANEVQKMSNETAKFAMEIAGLLKSLGSENGKIINEIKNLDKIVNKLS